MLDSSLIYFALDKCAYKQRYIAGSARSSTKPLPKLSTSRISAVKTRLQSYCWTCYIRDCANQMWILTNSKDLLEYITSRFIFSYNTRRRRNCDRMVVYNYLCNQYLSIHLSSNPAHAEVYWIQHYVISLSVTCSRSVVFSANSGFLHQ